jgi:hypothetical protein
VEKREEEVEEWMVDGMGWLVDAEENRSKEALRGKEAVDISWGVVQCEGSRFKH